MPILGSQGASAKGAPTAPTIGTATVTNSTTVSLTFTAPSFSKLPITSYTVTSSPSIALSTSGTSSPLTVIGSFVTDQSYTFTIVANHANASSTASSASNSIIPSPNTYAGYSIGGYSSTTFGITGIDKIAFSNDAVSGIAATLSVGKFYASNLSNSGVAGYIGGGQTASANSSTIEKLTFSSEARSNLSATYGTPRGDSHGAMSNSGTAGYAGGGVNGSGTSVNSIDKILYSNDTTSTLSAVLPWSTYGRRRNPGTANSGTAGYTFGGYNYPEPLDGGVFGNTATILKLAFSGETTSKLAAELTNRMNEMAAFSNNGVASIISGGSGGGANFNKFTYSNETRSITALYSSAGRSMTQGGMAHSGVAGYIVGEYSGAVPYMINPGKYLFSNDTYSYLSGSLTTGTYATTGIANSGVL